MSATTITDSPLSTAVVRPRRSLLARALFGLAVVLGSAIGSAYLLHASIDPAEDTAVTQTRNENLAGLASWAFLPGASNAADLAASHYDLIVVDEPLGAASNVAPRASTLAVLGLKPDGERRLVLARLSADADLEALERIVRQGFAGIQLYRGSGHADAMTSDPDARAELIGRIERMAQYAREKVPGFMVVLEDAESLLDSPRVRKTIDAVAKRNLLYTGRADEKPNDADAVATSVAALKRAQRDGVPVLVVETLGNDAAVASARDRLFNFGFTPYIATRTLAN